VSARHSRRRREILVTDLARLSQNPFDRRRIAANAGVQHLAAVEEHVALVVAELRRHTQCASLSAQVEQLKDVMNSELAEWSFDGH